MKLKDSNDVFGNDLRDPEFIALFLSDLFEDEDPRGFLLGLREVAQANTFSKVAEEAGVGRENLYKALSGAKNPRMDTVHAVLKALGCRLAVVVDTPAASGEAEPNKATAMPVAA